MIVCSTALLYYVIDKSGAVWEGVGAAWMLAAFMDACIAALFIYAKYLK